MNEFEKKLYLHSQSVKKHIVPPVNIEGGELIEKRKKIKTKFLLMAAAVAVLGATTAFAAMNFDILKAVFIGDFSAIGQFVKTPQESISDEKFKLTVDETLSDGYNIFIMGSIEGLTDEATAELMADKDWPWDIISVSQKSDTVSFALYEASEKRTSTTRYFVYCDRFENPLKEPLRLSSDKVSGGQHITIPTEGNIETKVFTIPGQSYGDVSIILSPIGIRLEKWVEYGSYKDQLDNKIFFRMKNGEIRTYHQLASMFHGFETSKKEYPGYIHTKYNAQFIDAVPLSEFKSIIIDSIEYDINNPAKTNTVNVEEKLKPFELEGVFFGDGGLGVCLPVEEVCDRLGAQMTWDGKCLTIKYRGSTVLITDHSDTYIKDGKVMPWVLISSQKNIFRTYEGKLYAEFPVLAESLCVGAYELLRKFESTSEAGTANDAPEGEKRIFYIIP